MLASRVSSERSRLIEERHPGEQPSVRTPKLQARILAPIKNGPNDGSTHWSCRKLASRFGVSKDTVLKLKSAGLLEYRNTAPPGSSRPVYAFALRTVMELRTSYERDDATPRLPRDAQRRRVPSQNKKYKHVKLES